MTFKTGNMVLGESGLEMHQLLLQEAKLERLGERAMDEWD